MTDQTYLKDIENKPEGLDLIVLGIVARHQGEDQAIFMEILYKRIVLLYGLTDLKERQIRDSIHTLRRTGHLICSKPGTKGGYYMAASLKEVLDFCKKELHAKAEDLLYTEKIMKEMARHKFGDQLTFEGGIWKDG